MSDTELFWTTAGSLVVALGSSVAGLYAFRDRILLVMLGFLLFIAGYRVSQVGIHGSAASAWDALSVDVGASVRPTTVTRGLLLVVGWVGIATGVTLFAQTILEPSTSRAVVAGVSSIGGYMCAHVGINGAGLGDSFLEPIRRYAERPPERRNR